MEAPDGRSVEGDALVRGTGSGPVVAGDGEVGHEREDRGEEDPARDRGAEPEAAVRTGLGEEVAERGAEGPGEDVGHPEGEDRVQLQELVGGEDDRDRAGED